MSILTQPLVTTSGDGGPVRGTGEGKDVERAPRPVWRKWLPYGIGALVVLLLISAAVWAGRGGQRLRVEEDRLRISTAQTGDFLEYVAVNAAAQPLRTIYLDAVVGGQVRERYVEEGAVVAAGTPLLRLENDNLTLQQMQSEASLVEQANGIRNTRLALDQNQLNLSQQLAQLDYDLGRAQREHDRLKGLFDQGLVPAQEYEDARDELAYLSRRRDLTLQSHRQDSVSRTVQIEQMRGQQARLQQNMSFLGQTVDNLIVRAPVAGQLTSLDAEIGELKGQGSRLGQIDVIGGFRLVAQIDEHYVARVATGQQATATISGADYELEVRKVYPEVTNGRFQVDLVFLGEPPPSLRRGRSVQVRLQLGQPEQALLLERGGFFQATGGRWAYVVRGGEAVRVPITLGRQNPLFFEVTDGLQPGDRVVTSSYDTFGDADVLVLN